MIEFDRNENVRLLGSWKRRFKKIFRDCLNWSGYSYKVPGTAVYEASLPNTEKMLKELKKAKRDFESLFSSAQDCLSEESLKALKFVKFEIDRSIEINLYRKKIEKTKLPKRKPGPKPMPLELSMEFVRILEILKSDRENLDKLRSFLKENGELHIWVNKNFSPELEQWPFSPSLPEGTRWANKFKNSCLDSIEGQMNEVGKHWRKNLCSELKEEGIPKYIFLEGAKPWSQIAISKTRAQQEYEKRKLYLLKKFKKKNEEKSRDLKKTMAERDANDQKLRSKLVAWKNRKKPRSSS